MVETSGYLVGEWEKGCGRGAGRSEAVLGFREGEVVGKLGKEEPFENLNCWAEKGDGPV